MGQVDDCMGCVLGCTLPRASAHRINAQGGEGWVDGSEVGGLSLSSLGSIVCYLLLLCL